MQEGEFRLVDDATEMIEVFPEIVNRLPNETLLFRRVRAIRGGMARGDILTEFFHVGDGQQARLELPVQPQVLVETQHLHRVFERLAVTADNGFVRRSQDRHDAEIYLRRPRPVEAQFFFAKMLAFLQRAEIEKVEHYRLLDFVGVVTGKDDPGDVRLHEFDVIGGVGERIFPQQRPDEARVDVC